VTMLRNSAKSGLSSRPEGRVEVTANADDPSSLFKLCNGSTYFSDPCRVKRWGL